MARIEKSGVYQIRCVITGDIYVGASRQIYRRWSQHRWTLRAGRSMCFHLQKAWTQHGENNFEFSILETCPIQNLEEREQHFVDTIRPSLNIVYDVSGRVSDRHIKNLVAFNRARCAAITHCPRGHAYDAANTYFNKKGKRMCRACNAQRVSAIYAKETHDQRELRRIKVKDSHQKNRQQRLMSAQKYAAAHRSEKRDYDRRRREALKDPSRLWGSQTCPIFLTGE